MNQLITVIFILSFLTACGQQPEKQIMGTSWMTSVNIPYLERFMNILPHEKGPTMNCAWYMWFTNSGMFQNNLACVGPLKVVQVISVKGEYRVDGQSLFLKPTLSTCSDWSWEYTPPGRAIAGENQESGTRLPVTAKNAHFQWMTGPDLSNPPVDRRWLYLKGERGEDLVGMFEVEYHENFDSESPLRPFLQRPANPLKPAGTYYGCILPSAWAGIPGMLEPADNAYSFVGIEPNDFGQL